MGEEPVSGGGTSSSGRSLLELCIVTFVFAYSSS